MNKTRFVVATGALGAIALGLFLMLSAPSKVAVQSAPNNTVSVRPAGHPVLDRFEDVHHQMQHKNAISAVKAAYDATVDHSANRN